MTSTPPSSDTGAAGRADRADRVDGQCMQASLGALLDRVPGSRGVVPHLAALERALGARGASAIESIPPAGLMRICGQLASLPLPDDDGPLDELQTRLMKALAGDNPVAPTASPAKAGARRGLVAAMPFVDSRLLSVEEASMTAFDAAIAAQGERDALDPFA